MVSISKYNLEYNKNENIYYVRTEEVSICPICLAELVKKGRRKRKQLTLDGLWQILSIRRLKCNICQKMHHELPDCIVPYKRHSTQAIENIIDSFNINVSSEESTIRRIKTWWALLQIYIRHIAASLSAKYGDNIIEVKKIAEIVRMLVNSNFWPGTRSALKPG